MRLISCFAICCSVLLLAACEDQFQTRPQPQPQPRAATVAPAAPPPARVAAAPPPARVAAAPRRSAATEDQHSRARQSAAQEFAAGAPSDIGGVVTSGYARPPGADEW